MINQAVDSVPSLHLKRTFDAPIARVYEAWTKAEIMSQWFCPAKLEVLKTEIDLKVGGKYSILLLNPPDTKVHHFGEYVDIETEKRLIFTWIIEGQQCSGHAPEAVDTLVSIFFYQTHTGTELELLHEKLPNQQARELHEYGWTACIDCLDSRLKAT
jgi:uncharacterized protein YndB with AHSA1/START domain